MLTLKTVTDQDKQTEKKQVEQLPQVVFPSPKSEPNLESNFVFRNGGRIERERGAGQEQSASAIGSYQIGTISPIK